MFSNDGHALAHTHTQFYSDRAVQRDVMEVLVKCENHSTGCPWTGQLKNWEVRWEGGREGGREEGREGGRGGGGGGGGGEGMRGGRECVCRMKRISMWKDNVLDYTALFLPPSQDHIDVCVYQAVTCPHKGCGMVLPYNQLESHELTCPFRRVICEHCNTELTISQLEVRR